MLRLTLLGTKLNSYAVSGLIDAQGFAEAIGDGIDGSKHRFMMGYWENSWGDHQGGSETELFVRTRNGV